MLVSKKSLKATLLVEILRNVWSVFSQERVFAFLAQFNWKWPRCIYLLRFLWRNKKSNLHIVFERKRNSKCCFFRPAALHFNNSSLNQALGWWCTHSASHKCLNLVKVSVQTTKTHSCSQKHFNAKLCLWLPYEWMERQFLDT